MRKRSQDCYSYGELIQELQRASMLRKRVASVPRINTREFYQEFLKFQIENLNIMCSIEVEEKGRFGEFKL